MCCGRRVTCLARMACSNFSLVRNLYPTVGVRIRNRCIFFDTYHKISGINKAVLRRWMTKWNSGVYISHD